MAQVSGEFLLNDLDDDSEHIESSAEEEEQNSPTGERQHASSKGHSRPASTTMEQRQQKAKSLVTALNDSLDNVYRKTAEKKGLDLLHLPLDILESIMKEIPHTNDLCSLALTCSALHRLATPHIYSRFDIVWPDTATNVDPRLGVDALTYGLSTLVMAAEVFGEIHQPPAVPPKPCSHCGFVEPSEPPPPLPTSAPAVRRRRFGNHYAQHTRKFSLGNGPREWVKEYMITKEAGKLLGTQVALAVARMRNLESFVWDMPTGVLREVWMALASLEDRSDQRECRLERVWIRWHNNRLLDHDADHHPLAAEAGSSNAHHTATAAYTTGHGTAVPPPPSQAFAGSLDWNVEHPTFSVVPALKSLSVLDVDELDYLDEMSHLIKRSRHKLRELRIGIASHANADEWMCSTTDRERFPNDISAERVTAKINNRIGGILGTIFSQIFQLGDNGITRTPGAKLNQQESVTSNADDNKMEPMVSIESRGSTESSTSPIVVDNGVRVSLPIMARSAAPRFFEDLPPADAERKPAFTGAELQTVEMEDTADRLALQVLELERVPLSVFTLKKTLDWSKLHDITLLDCQKHEQLWKALRREFSPVQSRGSWNTGDRTSPSQSVKSPRSKQMDFVLNLKKIHVNAVTPALISFLKEALLPNSLEILFLQMSASEASAITVDQIYKGPLRRHKGSLKKLMIDSTKRDSTGKAVEGNRRWNQWLVDKTVLGFITSGKMPKLRELCICIDHADWHYFLQHLPSISHLRSLYLPNISERCHTRLSPRDLALQILDIVILRPEVELCYLGILNKCYEILEGVPNEREAEWIPNNEHDDHDDDNADDDDDDDDAAAGEDDDEQGDDDDDDSGADDAGGATSEDDADSDDDGSVFDDAGKDPRSSIRLREILFYDDKVSVFKARHGRL